MYILGECSMIIISLGTILEAEMTTRAAMEASKLGAKKMLFVLGKTQPSDWASRKIHEHNTTCRSGKRGEVECHNKATPQFLSSYSCNSFPIIKLTLSSINNHRSSCTISNDGLIDLQSHTELSLTLLMAPPPSLPHKTADMDLLLIH